MGGKRRRSFGRGGGGGIRSKRGSTTLGKQTLVRVAEQKEASERKVRRRLEDAEARELERTRVALGIQSGLVERDTKQVVVDEEEKADPAKIRYLQKCAVGYGALVDGLAQPLFQGEEKEEREERQVEVNGSGTEAIAKRGRKDTEEKVKEVPPEEVSEPQLSLELENFEAAAREKAHFDREEVPPAPNGKLSLVGTFEGVGRVSAMISPERLASLEARLNGGLSGMTERSLGLQPSVHARWIAMRGAAVAGERLLGSLERAFVSVLREYYDVFLCRKLTDAQDDEVRRLYVAHCVAHVLRARARVARNDAAVKKDPEAVDQAKDQGFSRARVLILLPMKNLAYEVVKTLTALAVGPGPNVQNSERFESEFAPGPEDEEAEGDSDGAKGIRKGRRKPADHRRTFRGNIEDDFKLGVSFAKKSVKLYADFLQSDVIIASPLGLRRTIAEKATGRSAHERLSKRREDEDTEWKSGLGAARQEPKQDDADDGFLSSIEICIVDGAHVFSMQNWDTLRKAVSMMNKMPSNTRDTDFSRVRGWCLDGLMRRFRQTVVLAQYRKSEFVSLVRDGANHSGRVQLLEPAGNLGSMADVVVSMRQTFFKMPDVDSPAASVERRFSFFFSQTLPLLRCLLDAQVLLVVPSYFDYVRIRNKLVAVTEEDAGFRFVSMCEYSRGADVSRARARLHDRSVRLALMTERFHFFWRHWLRGADTVVWYGLPENAEFYPEICNMTKEEADKGRNVQTFVLYDEWDVFRLERVVGQKRCRKMIEKAARSAFLFV